MGNARAEGRSVAEYDHKLMFRPFIAWSRISSGKLSLRFYQNGAISDTASPSIYSDSANLLWLLGFCNSSVASCVAEILSPTLNYTVGQIASYPVQKGNTVRVVNIVNNCITQSCIDYFMDETSIGYKKSSLIALNI